MDNTQLSNIYEHNTNSNQPLEKLLPLVTLLNKAVGFLNKVVIFLNKAISPLNKAIIF